MISTESPGKYREVRMILEHLAAASWDSAGRLAYPVMLFVVSDTPCAAGASSFERSSLIDDGRLLSHHPRSPCLIPDASCALRFPRPSCSIPLF